MLASGRPPIRPISQKILDWQDGSWRERTPKELIISRMGNVASSWAAFASSASERLRRLSKEKYNFKNHIYNNFICLKLPRNRNNVWHDGSQEETDGKECS